MFHVFENDDFQDFEMFEKNITTNDPDFSWSCNRSGFFEMSENVIMNDPENQI